MSSIRHLSQNLDSPPLPLHVNKMKTQELLTLFESPEDIVALTESEIENDHSLDDIFLTGFLEQCTAGLEDSILTRAVSKKIFMK